MKVCCIGSRDEAALAVRWGAAALGLVSEMPSGPGVIAEDEIARIARGVPAGVLTVLLTAHTDPAEIAAQQRRTGVRAVQLVDRIAPEGLARLRRDLPGIALLQVVHVRGERSRDEAREAAPHVDAVLLDSGDPDLPVKELGGTGRTHDWSLSRRIADELDCAVFLAGGLSPGNVREAIDTVRPFGLDLCSGVRRDGALDERLLARFMRAVARAEDLPPGPRERTADPDGAGGVRA